MNPPQGGPTVLIVDEDIGFLWWLGEIFREIGFRCFPALNADDAVGIARAPSVQVTLLVLNPRIPAARVVIDAFAQKTPPKILLVTDGDTPRISGFAADAFLARPSSTESLSREEWGARIRRLLLKIDSRAAS